MHITGVTIFSYKNSLPREQLHPYANKKSPHYSFKKNLSFTAIKTPGEFRLITKTNKIHCPYCNKIMIYGGTLNDMLKSGVFSGSAKDFVKAVSPYEESLKRGHKVVFNQIKKYAQQSPQTHVSEIIQLLYSKSIKSLVKTQSNIFKELISKSKELSPDMQKNFREFIKIQHKRLYEIPTIQKFNSDTFAYKMKKMAGTISNEGLKNYICTLADALNNKELSKNNKVISDLLKSSTKGQNTENLNTIQVKKIIIDKINKVGERLDRRDIQELCKTSNKMLEGRPVVVSFSNKEFMRDLATTQLQSIRKTPLYYEMIEIAKKLPSSKSNMNSFVVKHKYSDSDTIGYKLLEPSITTIEHIKPRSEQGEDVIENMALACKFDNNERQSIPQYIYLNKWNKRNPQKYFNDIINLSNKEDTLDSTQITQMAKAFDNEGHVKINITKIDQKAKK